MIDLSFLTEEEQEIIQDVLKRDAELKKAEEQRIQSLQKKVSDRGLLRYMTGEWFYETKQLRHRERIHGTDIVRASMKQAQKPLTLLELTQMFSEKPPLVSGGNEEAFAPPVVTRGRHADPSQNHQSREALGDAPKPALRSPPKQRTNPFNSRAEEKSGGLPNGRAEGASVPCGSSSLAGDLRADLPDDTVMHNAFVPRPAEENTAVSIGRWDRSAEVDRPGGGDNDTPTHGIPEHQPIASSTAHLEPRNPVDQVSSAQTWRGRKQLRLSSEDAPRRAAWRDGKELGEHGLLDMDCPALEEAEKGDLEGAVSLDLPSDVPQLLQAPLHQEPKGRNQDLSDQEVARHPSLYGFQSFPEPGVSEEDSIKTKDSKTETQDVRNSQDEAADVGPGHRVCELPEQSSGSYEAISDSKQSCETSTNTRLVHVSAKSERSFHGLFQDEAGSRTHEDEDGAVSEHSETDDTQGLSQSAGSKEDKPAASAELGTVPLPELRESPLSDPAGGQASPLGPADVEIINDDSSPKKMTFLQMTDAPQGPDELLRIDCVVDLSGEDGLYRAKPIVIYETDDASTESQPQENIFGSTPSSQTFHKEGLNSALLPFIVADGSTVDVSPQREEGLPKDGATSSTFNDSTDSSELTQPHPGSGTSKGEQHSSSPLSRSPDKSPLRTPGGPEDLKLSNHKVKAHPPQTPLSPSKSHSPKVKGQQEEVRRSPSKTCHPRVLPRESTSPQTPSVKGSPLKTFPINIDPQRTVPEEHHGRPTPVPRQRRSPSHQAKQTGLGDAKNIADSSPLKAEEEECCVPNVTSGRSSTAPQPSPSLARSCVPQDYQHYLGPQEKAFVPPFHPEKSTSASSSDPTEGAGSGDRVKDRNLGPGTATAWTGASLSSETHSSSPQQDYREASVPVITLSKPSPSKRMSSSKSLETLISQPGEERNKDRSQEYMNKSVDADLQQIKSSLSVPVLQLEEQTDSDGASEPTLRRRRNTGSSMSNFSLSSGMNSMSSVSSSISSLYPADFGDLEVQGSVQFAVNYIHKLGEFHVFVVNCRDLAVADAKKNRSDPYVKCYLLPDKSKLGKRKTTVKKKTSHPTFNEILRFKIPLEVLRTQDLNVSVWHNDTFGRNSFLGEVLVDLSERDFGDTRISEYALQARVGSDPPSPPPPPQDTRGRMRVAARFLPQTSHRTRTSLAETGEVQIWVKDCKDLPPVRGVTIDPFVKCTVLPDTSRRSRQKTRVVKRTANPMFNHTMVYDGFRGEDLREACVEITVWDHDRLHHRLIGGLRLGLGTGKSYGVDVAWMDSTPEEARLWQRMLQADGEWVEDVLPLRLLRMTKSK